MKIALHLLTHLDTEHQTWIENTRQQIATGIAELDRGEGIDGPTVMNHIFSNFRRHGKRFPHELHSKL